MGEEEARQEHPGQHAFGEVVGRHGDDHGGQHHHAGTLRVLAQVSDGAPVESADGNHDHHGYQSGHGNLRHPVTQEHDQDEQHHARCERGQAPATTRLHVDDRLTNHGAARHAADEACGDVGNALAHALAVLVALGVRQVIHDGRGHQRLQQADHHEGERVREDDGQRLPGQRDVRNEEHRQAVWQVAHVTHGADVEVQRDGDPGEHDDGDQGRWHRLRDVGQAVDDAETRCRHGVDVPRHVGEFGQLGKEDQDGEGVHETRDHRPRHEPHQGTQTDPPSNDLKDPGEHRGGQQVVQAMVFHQRNHQERHGTRGGGNHSRSAPGEGNDGGNGERGVQAHLRVYPGNDGEGNRLRDEGESDDQTRE